MPQGVPRTDKMTRGQSWDGEKPRGWTGCPVWLGWWEVREGFLEKVTSFSMLSVSACFVQKLRLVLGIWERQDPEQF